MEKEKLEMNELQVVEKPELNTEAIAIQDRAVNLVIKSNEDNEFAIGYIKTIKQMIKKIKEELDPNIERANKLHKELTAQRSRYVSPLVFAENTIKNKSIAYQMEVKRKIEEEERKKKEQARLAEERRKKELEDQAKKAEEKGNTEKAEMLRDKKEEVFVQPKPVKTEAPKVQGSAMVDNWTAIVVDIDKVPDAFINKVADMASLNAIAKSSKGKKEIPGVEFVNKSYMRTGK